MGPERRDGPTATEDLEALMESVRRHLGRVLNSRHGMSECLPDYGLPALSDLTIGIGDYVQTVQEAVQTAIEKYEPRLRRVRVSRVADEEQGRTLAFRVDAVLVAGSGEHRVWYQTSLQGNGQFDVEA
jgi:type VI secretion system protein